LSVIVLVLFELNDDTETSLTASGDVRKAPKIVRTPTKFRSELQLQAFLCGCPTQPTSGFPHTENRRLSSSP
jgi:hypothetical protein